MGHNYGSSRALSCNSLLFFSDGVLLSDGKNKSRIFILVPLLIVIVAGSFWLRQRAVELGREADRLEQENQSQSEASTESQSSSQSSSSTSAEGQTATQPQLNVHRLGPDEYYLNRMAYITTPTGQLLRDSILLPQVPPPLPKEALADTHGYVGPEACAECHQENFDGFIHTAHAKTSAIATKDSVLGSFRSGENSLETASPNLRFEMIERDGRLLQRMLLDVLGPEGTDSNTDSTSNASEVGETASEADVMAEFPFDIVTGSGKVGQTYLYSQGEHLYQLHASYLTSTDKWMNSPGYIDGIADFARPVLINCLECHSTFVRHYETSANQFQMQGAVFGVTCERCHGPGQSHVDYHHSHPDAKEPREIVNPANLTVERSMEVCQMCHGGTASERKQPPFTFRPGEDLSEYYAFPPEDGSEINSGVHTNTQLPRLKRSKCFTESGTMTCVDCHNPHRHERGDMRLFSERCLQCHEMPDCGKFETLGERLSDNCIDCHMLNVEMSDIRLISEGSEFVPRMRDHYIKPWEEATEAYLERLQSKSDAP